jgi:hypothetical protein
MRNRWEETEDGPDPDGNEKENEGGRQGRRTRKFFVALGIKTPKGCRKGFIVLVFFFIFFFFERLLVPSHTSTARVIVGGT